MKNYLFGYVRVSSADQNEIRQVEALKAEGIDERNIYIDKKSGADFNREKYAEMIDRLREGDLLVVKSIDRLGRNYNDILEQWRHITQGIKANIKVLDMTLLDTTVSPQSLDSRFVADLVLQILCYVAEKERRHIRERQAEGIAIAKTQGKLGRPKVERPAQWNEVYTKWENKEITAVAAIEVLGLKMNMFYKFVAEERAEVK